MDTSHRTLSRFISFFSALLIIAVLYFGRAVLMPLALACLFTFLLNPLVKLLCRWRLPRPASVGIVTVVSFSALALVAWLLGAEMTKLANELPDHRHNIKKRVESLQKLGDTGVIQRLRRLVGYVSESTRQAPSSEADTASENNAPATPASAPAPPPQPPESPLLKALNMVVPTLADVAGTAALVILFVIFMLLRLNDISERIARLVGFSRLTLTTKAIDEAGERISSYLLMQGTVNAIYGTLLASGLLLVGLPYVVLWGALGAMFRFIPYVGPWIVAVLPIGLSLAVFDGWTLPLVVIAFIIVLELVTNMILEPILYGHSAGVFDFALLIAIAFWTWLWGGVGLVLATPLTVCIVAFCKHLHSLEWVNVLMGDSPPSQPHLSYYQHHLASNEDAAQSMAEEAVRKDGVEGVLENLALPALALTRREHVLGGISPDEAAQIYQSMRTGFTLLKEVSEDSTARDHSETPQSSPPPVTTPQASKQVLKVFGRALHGEADAQALEMLAAVLPPTVEMEISTEPRLIGELVHEIEKDSRSIICISALPPRAQLAATSLCRRLRSKLPDRKILVCRWGLLGQELDPKPLREAGATWVVATLKEARGVLEGLIASNEGKT